MHKKHLKTNFFFQFLVGHTPQLGLWSDGKLELPSQLEEPSGNCQMAHIIQNLFHVSFLIFFIFSVKGGWWVGSRA